MGRRRRLSRIAPSRYSSAGKDSFAGGGPGGALEFVAQPIDDVFPGHDLVM
jgi:hypothetical protein